jgi:hypothetical protein
MFYSFANTFARDQGFLKHTRITQLTQSNMVVFEVTFWPMSFVLIDSSQVATSSLASEMAGWLLLSRRSDSFSSEVICPSHIPCSFPKTNVPNFRVLGISYTVLWEKIKLRKIRMTDRKLISRKGIEHYLGVQTKDEKRPRSIFPADAKANAGVSTSHDRRGVA